MMLYSPFMFSSVLAGFALMMATFHPIVDAATTIEILSIGNFAFDTEGATSITVNYQMDGTVTFGPEAGGNNFYVKQSLQGPDCSSADTRDFLTAFTDTEPATYGASNTVTTLARGAVPFPEGATSFCLRVKLMLDMIDTTDQLWQQVDFQFTVTAVYPDGTDTAEYSATESFGQANDELDGGTASDTTTPPVITATLAGGPFKYGDDIPIVVGFQHTLNVFGYTLTTTEVFLSPSDSSTPLTLNSNEVKPIIGSWATAFNFDSKTIGTLTVRLPLIIYQSDAVDSVKVNIPVSWSYNVVRRRLQAASGTYTGPRSGVTSGVVEVELEPYRDESGAIVGFTVTSVVSSFCLGAATLLL